MLVLIDKEADISSSACLNKFKRVFGIKKCGYAGTLDPFATGLLVVGCYKGTKLLDCVLGLKKEYVFKVRFGEETDSGDITGLVVHSGGLIPSCDQVEVAIRSSFIGDIAQVPPIYSALKSGGKRICDLARSGAPDKRLDEIARLKERIVRVDEFSLIGFDGELFEFRVVCSKGTYIRKLVVDLGRALGTFANTVSLRRVSIGSFNVSNALCSRDFLSGTTLASGSVSARLGLLPDELVPYSVSLDGTE